MSNCQDLFLEFFIIVVTILIMYQMFLKVAYSSCYMITFSQLIEMLLKDSVLLTIRQKPYYLP